MDFAFVFVLRFVIGGDEDTWICDKGEWIKHGNPYNPKPDEECKKETGEENNSVPLPSEEDTIRSFFRLIDENKVTGAVSMLSEELVSSESAKQAYGVQFNAIEFANVVDINPSDVQAWDENQKQYEVIVDIKMNPDSSNEVIPYYGWMDGENIRWITLKKENSLWKIDEIATGK